MSRSSVILAARIKSELKELSEHVVQAEQGWERVKRTTDDVFINRVALKIHAFYSVLELIFEKIASTIDHHAPSGVNWHQELLDQMSFELSGVRPAVISSGLKERLDEYRRFRYAIQTVYRHHLSTGQIKLLVEKLRATYNETEKELSVFARFLEEAQ